MMQSRYRCDDIERPRLERVRHDIAVHPRHRRIFPSGRFEYAGVDIEPDNMGYDVVQRCRKQSVPGANVERRQCPRGHRLHNASVIVNVVIPPRRAVMIHGTSLPCPHPPAGRLALVTGEARGRVGASPRDLAAVFVGGLIGTTLRVLVDLAMPHDASAFALSTLLVNVSGSFALGLLVAALWPRVSGWVRAGLGPGILGSFTTFSALAVSVVALAQNGDVVGAVLSIVLSIGFGMLAAWAGLALGARLARGQTPEVKEVDE